MDIDTNLVLICLMVLPVYYLTGLLHEFGHAVLGWWCGFTVTSFGMGVGRPLWVGRWGQTRVYVCLRKPFQGITFSFSPRIFPVRWRSAGMLAGGIIANATAAVVCLGLWWLLPQAGVVWMTVGGVNAVMALANCVPLAFPVGTAVLRSDGAQILAVLFGRGTAADPPQRIQMLRGLRGLWESVGDSLGLWAHVVEAGLAWRELGDEERCRTLVEEAERLPLERAPTLRAFETLARSVVLAPTDRDAARPLLDEAEAWYRENHHEAGSFLTAWLRGDIVIQAGDGVAAEAVLEPLTRHPLIAGRPALGLGLLVDRLSAAVTRDDAAEARRLLNEYQDRRAAAPSVSREFLVSRLMGQFHARHANWVGAAAHYLSALGSARQLCLMFGDDDDQAHFVKCQERLRTEAREALLSSGQAEQAEKVDAFFPSPEQIRQEKEKWLRTRNQSLWRKGMALALTELILGAVAFGLMMTRWSHWLEEETAGTVLASAFMLGFGAALALVVGSFTALMRKAVGWFGRSGGAAVMFLALIPWLSVVFFVALLMLGLLP